MASPTQTLQAESHELRSIPAAYSSGITSTKSLQPSMQEEAFQLQTDSDDPTSTEALFSTSAIPDGGYGWTIVLCASIVTFWNNGLLNCWGILQAGLLKSTLSHVPTSTVSFVGSVNLALSAAFGLPSNQFARRFGSRTAAMLGVTLMGIGLIGAGWCTDEVAPLFVTVGVLGGVGMSSAYATTNNLPVQYFSGKLGLANGLVKLGGGVGATVMAIALEALVQRVGISWTFRIQGMMTIGFGLAATWFMRDRVPLRKTKVPFVDFSMFRSVPFTAVFLAGATGTFALFVPPYYLPLFAESIGLSSSTGAALVAAFNACNALGRFAGGPFCDKIGPINTLVITMVLNAVSMLAIWPVSRTLVPLIIFAVINGIANGAFFTVFPTVVASIFGPGRAAVAMSMSITGWTFGYLLGTPIAGYLLQAATDGQKAAKELDVEDYRPAIFYAGGVALIASLFALLARAHLSKKIKQKV